MIIGTGDPKLAWQNERTHTNNPRRYVKTYVQEVKYGVEYNYAHRACGKEIV